MSPKTASALALALACIAAPAASAAGAAAQSDTTNAANRVTVQITNDNFQDMNILAVYGGQRFRLGTVVSTTTQTFTLPATLVGTTGVRIIADPIGSFRGFVSEPLSLDKGDVVELRISAFIPQSSYRIGRS